MTTTEGNNHNNGAPPPPQQQQDTIMNPGLHAILHPTTTTGTSDNSSPSSRSPTMAITTATTNNNKTPVVAHRKVAVLGYRAVGKSCLTNAFVSGSFSDVYEPTIESTHSKMIRFKKVHFATDIVDTAGMDEFSRLSRNASLGVHGYILVFSITSRQSFDMIEKINASLLHTLGDAPGVPRILVGCMADLAAVSTSTQSGGWENNNVDESSQTFLQEQHQQSHSPISRTNNNNGSSYSLYGQSSQSLFSSTAISTNPYQFNSHLRRQQQQQQQQSPPQQQQEKQTSSPPLPWWQQHTNSILLQTSNDRGGEDSSRHHHHRKRHRRQVSSMDAQRLADKWGIPYMECSSKTGEHVKDVFHILIKEIEKDNGLIVFPEYSRLSGGCNVI